MSDASGFTREELYAGLAESCDAIVSDLTTTQERPADDPLVVLMQRIGAAARNPRQPTQDPGGG